MSFTFTAGRPQYPAYTRIGALKNTANDYESIYGQPFTFHVIDRRNYFRYIVVHPPTLGPVYEDDPYYHFHQNLCFLPY